MSEWIAGFEEAFVQMMNTKTKQLRMNDIILKCGLTCVDNDKNKSLEYGNNYIKV